MHGRAWVGRAFGRDHQWHRQERCPGCTSWRRRLARVACFAAKTLGPKRAGSKPDQHWGLQFAARSKAERLSRRSGAMEGFFFEKCYRRACLLRGHIAEAFSLVFFSLPSPLVDVSRAWNFSNKKKYRASHTTGTLPHLGVIRSQFDLRMHPGDVALTVPWESQDLWMAYG